MKITVEAIQKTPIGCMNRDREGRIKTVKMGGVTRTRISSQCSKRAVREAMSTELGQLSYRTKNLKQLVYDKLIELAPGEEDGELLVDLAFKCLSRAKDKNTKDSKDALSFVSDSQAQAFAQAILDNREYLKKSKEETGSDKDSNKKGSAALRNEFEKILNGNMTADIALFGRMFAQNQNISHEAACQFADAFATHASAPQYDFFTAVDEYKGDEEAGAGHLDTNEFSTCTLYRYSAVDIDKLAEDIHDLTPDVISAFIRAFATSMPKAKTHSYGNTTLPDFLSVSISEGQLPVNHAGAFEKPVDRDIDGGGYAEPSIKRLVNYAERLDKAYECKPDVTYYINLTDIMIDKAYDNEVLCLSELCNEAADAVDKYLSQN